MNERTSAKHTIVEITTISGGGELTVEIVTICRIDGQILVSA